MDWIVDEADMKEQVSRVTDVIIQEICLEMDKQGMTIRGLAELSRMSYAHLCRILAGQTGLGFTTMLRIAYALRISPASLFPFNDGRAKTYGERFDDITKRLDLRNCNFLLNLCADYVKEYRRYTA